ncbi:MAG: lipid kinase [Actinomycetota bacterium]|nr:lipid kinase [Actinomycetota bacterium]
MSTARGPDSSLVVVANARAGGIDRLDEALAVLRTGGQTVVAVELSDPVELPASLGAVAGRTVVAAGGDGTLRVLAQHLWHQGVLADTVLGLLPLGTGNDLARTVGIPLDPADAAAVVLSGRCRPLDFLFDDTDTLAVNAVHCGVGGLAVRHAAPLKPFLGRLAYRVGAAWAGARAKGWQVRVELDDRVLFEGNALFVGIGNGTTIGGGAVLWPQARPNDGLADVLVVGAGNTMSRLAAATALRSGATGERDGVITGRGKSIRVRGEPIPYITDGDVCASRPSRSWWVRPAAWRLLVPVVAP